MVQRLYRSESNICIAGVCGGIGEYLNIDPVIVRLLWAVFTVLFPGGILIYILACLIIPIKENNVKTKVNITSEKDVKDETNTVKAEKDVVNVKIE